MIHIDALWLATSPVDMHAGPERLLARVVQVFGAAQAHHGYLPAVVLGRWFHLYLILDLYSRKIVGWEVHDSDSSEHAAHLVRRTALSEGIAALTTKPVLHGDNGSTLKATTLLTMLNWLGVKPSYSRPV